VLIKASKSVCCNLNGTLHLKLNISATKLIIK